MAQTIDGDEFITEVLSGERDFTFLRLDGKGANLARHSRYQELHAYLTAQDLKTTPLDFSHSSILNLHASYCDSPGLFIPYSRAQGSYWSNVDISTAVLHDSDFSRATLDNVCLWEADFSRVVSEGLQCQGRINLEGADIRGTNGLLEVSDSPYPLDFRRTKVTPKQRRALAKMLLNRYFITSENGKK